MEQFRTQELELLLKAARYFYNTDYREDYIIDNPEEIEILRGAAASIRLEITKRRRKRES